MEISSINVSIPNFAPRTLAAFVEPVFLLPCSLTSIPLKTFPIQRALGILPRIYANAINTIVFINLHHPFFYLSNFFEPSSFLFNFLNSIYRKINNTIANSKSVNGCAYHTPSNFHILEKITITRRNITT